MRLRSSARGALFDVRGRSIAQDWGSLQVELARLYTESKIELEAEEVWDQGNTDFAFEVFADDYVRHELRATEALLGPEGQETIADDFRAAFPDLRLVVDLIVGEDDYVVGRWTATGTHSGRWGAVEPTRRQATFSAVNIYRFENGKVAEIWNHRDDLGLAEQLGAPIYAGARPAS